MQMRMKRHYSGAFTLIELMTATGLTVVMLLLMAGLYSQTADIIRAGIATSDNIERSRAATLELVSIFDYMIPPSGTDTNTGDITSFVHNTNSSGNVRGSSSLHGGGMLVITNKMWSARGLYGPDIDTASGPLSDPLSWYPQVNSRRLGLMPDDIRSDMVSFFVYNNVPAADGAPEPLNLSALTPSSPTSFTGDSTNEGNVTVAKVWIGHTQLVGPEGEVTPSFDSAARTSTSVRPDKDSPLSVFDPVTDSFGVEIANEWVLGMQYMLTGFQAPATSGYYRELRDTVDSDVDPPPGTFDVLSNFDTTAYTKDGVFQAISDFAEYSFNDPAYAASALDGRLIIGNGESLDALLKPAPEATMQAVNTNGDALSPFEQDNELTFEMINKGLYKANALAMTYVNNRLYFNRAPNDSLESYLVAQTHPGFLPYCAEIVVEFAADCDGDGQIDREGFTDLFGASGRNANDPRDAPDGTDDKNLDINWNGIKDDGSIIWYSAFQSVNSSGERLGPCMRPNWRMELAPGDGGYRQMPDVRKRTTSQFPFNNADYGFIWRHDYPNNWPWLLRIRLRLMSRSGVLEFDPTEPQYDFKKRRLDPDNNYEPRVPADYNSSEVIDEYSSYDAKDISFGVNWDGNEFQGISNRLPGSWYEFIVPVRRQ